MQRSNNKTEREKSITQSHCKPSKFHSRTLGLQQEQDGREDIQNLQ